MSAATEFMFNSGNGMASSVWGPALWHFLHIVSFNYPHNPTEQQKREYTSFIRSLEHVLPCSYCRRNFPKNLKAVPLTRYALKNRRTFSRWMYRFHNEVNRMLGKSYDKSYEDVKTHYCSFRADCTEKVRSAKEHSCKNKKGNKKCVLKIVNDIKK